MKPTERLESQPFFRTWADSFGPFFMNSQGVRDPESGESGKRRGGSYPAGVARVIGMTPAE